MILSRSVQMALDVHIRTTRVDSPHMSYSYISGAAAKIGTDILEVTEDGTLYKNGQVLALDEDSAETSFDGYSLTKKFKGSKKRIIEYTLDLGYRKNVQIRSNTNSRMLFVDVNGAFVDGEGLLGAAPEGMPQTQPLLSRDGSTDLTGHWNTYGEDWQVNDTDPKLFIDTERHPQYPDGCMYHGDSNKKQKVRRRRLFEDQQIVTAEEAKGACAHLKDEDMRQFCVDDVLATGDVELAEDPFYAI